MANILHLPTLLVNMSSPLAALPGRSLQAKDYEKMVDNQIREALQQMEAADKQQQEVLRRWQLPDSLQVSMSVGSLLHCEQRQGLMCILPG